MGPKMSPESVEYLSFPDAILDGLCDIGRDSLKADQVYIFLYEGADVRIVAESRIKEGNILKRFSREFLNKDAKLNPSQFGNERLPPRHLFEGSRDFISLVSDNGSVGAFMIAFNTIGKRLTSLEKQIVRGLAKTAVSHIKREALLMKSAKKFLSVIDETKA